MTNKKKEDKKPPIIPVGAIIKVITDEFEFWGDYSSGSMGAVMPYDEGTRSSIEDDFLFSYLRVWFFKERVVDYVLVREVVVISDGS